MSSMDSTPSEEKIDSRFNDPTPELHDHRRRAPASPQPKAKQKMDVPRLELHSATPRASALDIPDLLHVDEALRQVPDASPQFSIARDFEQAVSDNSEDENDNVYRRGSLRRDTKRAGRPREYRPQDRSRDTSSSRSTSPANSVEAFAEGRKRQRANTANSRPESFIEFQRNRAGSFATTRRPTLSNISVPPALVARNTDLTTGVNFDTDSDAGKTYRIDFEELEEFVALCKQGKIPDAVVSSGATTESSSTRVFDDVRNTSNKDDFQNVALNGENFFEKPLRLTQTAGLVVNSNEQLLPKQQKKTSVPERFTFFSSEVQNARHATSLVDFVADGSKFQELFEVGPEGGVWWLDILNPTKSELDVIASAFSIHRLTKEDIETKEPREKVELFSQYYFVCFRSFNMDNTSEDFLDPIHVYIIVTQDGVLSFSYTPNPHASNVRRRIAKLGDFLSLGPDYICYAMIDDIVDCFAPIIHNAELESERIEDEVFVAREDDFAALLRQIGECRKKVLNLMRLLGGKADVIKGFSKRCNEEYEMTPRGDIGLYLGDIQDHVVTMMSNLSHVEKMLSRSHANYLAQLNVDNILKGNSTNKALAKITVVATILVPLNLITGLFGMNVPVPGRETENLGWFGGIVGVIALFVVVAVIIAKRLKLI